MKTINKVKEFFETEHEIHAYDAGYKIYFTDDPYFVNAAVVEDADGKRELIDISEHDYQDFDDFINLVIQKYEGRI